MLRIITILIVTLLVGCYNSADKPHIDPMLPVPTTTIERLHDIVGDGGVTLGENIIVEGRVTSTDADDNFYHTLVVESDGSALEVMVDFSPLWSRYPEGLMVVLCLDGCYADYGYGVMQVGRKGTGSYAVDYIASPEAMNRVIVRSTDVAPIAPTTTTIAQLDRRMCGRLVRIEDLHLVASSTDDARWEGYTLFKDECGDSIALYTRRYACFAEDCVPSANVDITGILQWGKYDGGKECFQLKMRYAEDCVAR